jgi:hypothetical protein
MQLNEQSVNAYKTILSNPSEHGMDFRPITECFEKSETATAQHILFKQYLEYLQKPLPKIIFYIVMAEIYGAPNGFDQEHRFGNHPNAPGCLGFYLKFKNE